MESKTGILTSRWKSKEGGRKVRRSTFYAMAFLKMSGERRREWPDRSRAPVHIALVKRRNAIPRDIVPVLNQVPLPQTSWLTLSRVRTQNKRIVNVRRTWLARCGAAFAFKWAIAYWKKWRRDETSKRDQCPRAMRSEK